MKLIGLCIMALDKWLILKKLFPVCNSSSDYESKYDNGFLENKSISWTNVVSIIKKILHTVWP